ncbi:MAG TPA: hypothetical protein VGN22_00325 [Pseudonocardia sp.]
MSTPDVVDQHVAELARALRGPGRTRRSILREVRDGLHDAAAAHRCCGLDPQQAAVRAVHDFGPARRSHRSSRPSSSRARAGGRRCCSWWRSPG